MYSSQALANVVDGQILTNHATDGAYATGESNFLNVPRLIGNPSKVLSRERDSYLTYRRIIEVFLSIFLITLLSPILVAIYLIIRFSSSGPAIIRQARLTKGGRQFDMLKFRTMLYDAEAACGPSWTQENDPRITRVGRYLRRLHLDELPQLVNVIKGEMSLIGPRPERPEFTEMLARELPNFRDRLDVPGGITGLAQVNFGYADDLESYRKKLFFDLNYVKNCSPKLDLIIALRTVLVLLTGSGAR